MIYRIILKPKAEKELKKLPDKDRKRVIELLKKISADPFSGKKLEGEFKNLWSLKVWPYRIIYYIHKKELMIIVIRIRHRQSSYK